MKTINYKKLTCAAALTLITVTANAGTNKHLIKKYKQASLKQTQVLVKKEQGKVSTVKKLTGDYRKQFKKAFSALRGKSLAQIQKELDLINKSPLNQQEKTRRIKALLKKEKGRAKIAGKKVRIKQRRFLSQLQKIYSDKKLQMHEMGSVLLHSPSSNDTEAYQDLVLSAPFSNTIYERVTNLAGITYISADEELGSIDNRSLVVEFGTAYAKTGMVETFRVPTGVRKIKLSTKIDITNFEIGSFAIGGIAAGYAGAYLEAFDGYETKCKREGLTGGTISPIAWVNSNEGRKTHLLACEFYVEENSEIAVSAGNYSFASAFLIAMPEVKTEGLVEHINVEFIE